MAMLGESMHADSEGLALAVADSQQSAAAALCIDAFQDLEIGQCATRLRLLVAAAFAMTLDYIKQRTAFGRPIGSFQHSRFLMAELKTKIEITRCFTTFQVYGSL